MRPFCILPFFLLILLFPYSELLKKSPREIVTFILTCILIAVLLFAVGLVSFHTFIDYIVYSNYGNY